MKIAICASMSLAKDIVDIKGGLEKLGHEVTVPNNSELYANGTFTEETKKESIYNKIKDDLIREYFNLIGQSDAILVINKDKFGIKNYIGGNTFLEIGFAHVHNKRIYLLNPVPEMHYKSEIEAMQPTVINNDIALI